RDQVDEDLKQDPSNTQAQNMRDQIDQRLKEMEGLEKELQSALEEEQDKAGDEGENADAEGEAETEGDAPDAGNGSGNNASPSDELTEEEAQRLLQSVRDKERQRRMKQAEAERSGNPSTGKDW
ncbi:MAG: hypothetical protein MK095_08425, partial [Phycisphaerales bacterium]|nr:hypothetical protein [Phycisphaerales bacterium]